MKRVPNSALLEIEHAVKHIKNVRKHYHDEIPAEYQRQLGLHQEGLLNIKTALSQLPDEPPAFNPVL